MRLSRHGRLQAVLFGAAAAAYGLDRITKLLAQEFLAGRAPVDLIPRVLRLNYTLNSGGAFGLFPRQPWVFFGATVVVCLAILAGSFRLVSGLTAVGTGMILGGALGNLTDRILHGPGVSGRVVDFIDFRVWPVFNLADASIVVGAALVVLAGMRRKA
ncbi:MAG TPA: signal peptidase II [Actinomycetota bacterium]|nr:signal peptidase II [Actinomycetota bacterium]